MTEITYEVDGMSCSGCESNVQTALEALDGVDSASPDHEAGRVGISLATEVDDSVLVETIEEAGYDVVG